MLYISAPELTHLITDNLCPLTNISFLPTAGSHGSPFCYYEFHFIILFFIFLKNSFIHERQRERERGREAGSLRGAQWGTRSQDPWGHALG